MQGLAHNSTKDIYKSYKELYTAGNEALPYLEKQLLPHDWSKIRNKIEMRYLCALVSLMNDIDENSCRKTVNSIISNGCAIEAKQCLQSIAAFSLDDYVSSTIRGMRVHIAQELEHPKQIQARLEEWLAVIPQADIVGIDRIYVVPYHEDYTYSGTYMPTLSYITLVWDNPTSKWNFVFHWIELFLIERTFYHEIGHHVCGHTFGQDEKQEEEADDYTKTFLLANHKILNSLVKTLKFLGIKKKEQQYV